MIPQSRHNGHFAVTLDGARYVQITNRSNLRHVYWPDVCLRVTELRGTAVLEREPSVAEILDAVEIPDSWTEIVFSGPGEPTLRLYDFLEAARRIREHAGRVCLTTDGLANLVYERDITPDLEGSVDHLIVTLHTHDQSSYERYFRSSLAAAHDAVVDFARRAHAFVPRLTLVAMDKAEGVDIDACQQIADEIGASFRPTVYVASATH